MKNHPSFTIAYIMVKLLTFFSKTSTDHIYTWCKDAPEISPGPLMILLFRFAIRLVLNSFFFINPDNRLQTTTNG
jgi:hypothetical protein